MALDRNFDPRTAEAAISAKWLEARAFRAGANARPGAEPFCIMIPPPNVTGSLHVGHAFNNTLQDILVRWHRMRGDDVLWQPGTDHAGIATQLVVEKELARTGNKGRRELGREAFLKKVWEWKAQSGGTIVEQLKRLGASCDWDREAFTMSGNFPEAVLKVFVDFYNKGLIYRGKRLVNWDPHFETAISDLEVENIEVKGQMWHFKYPLQGAETYEYIEKDAEGNVTLRERRDYISIATTRPETMLGDGAVAVHPSDERYAPIVGKLCEIPVGPKEHRRLIPIITDEYPDPAFGSGAVKITGAHDFNDYAVAKRAGIPCYRLMDTRAAMRADGAPYAEAAALALAVARGERSLDEAEADAVNLVPDDLRGLDRFEARKRVVEQITGEGLAVTITRRITDRETGEDRLEQVPYVEDKVIMQPFGDRSKVVIEPMLTDQWYVDAKALAGQALEAVKSGAVQILPERDKKIYYHWLENIEPWCISRQLWWGHQVPVWYDTDGRAYCAPTEAEARSQAGDRPLTRDPDVLDTWFSSGLWPLGTLGWPADTPELAKYYPTSTLVTGFDILFFWVARMMMMQIELTGKPPFRTIYLHALVRDEKGVKMSKTLGNVIDPIEIIDEYGADALRFALASMAALGGTLKLSRERIAGYRNFGTKLWNAARFAEMNDCLPLPGWDATSPRATANRWIVGETARIREVVDRALADYRFNEAALGLYAHVWGRLCDWYVELAKPLLASGDPALVAETRATMGWALDQCLKLLHPFMPFITEALWHRAGERGMLLCHARWPDYSAAGLADAGADAEMSWVISLIEDIRAARAELHVPAGAKVPLVALGLDAVAEARLDRNRTLIERLARIEAFSRADAAPKGAVTLPVQGGAFCLPLEGLIDLAAEQSRLTKARDRLAGELKATEAKLGNPAFTSRAPEEVVDELRDRLATMREDRAKLDAALERISSLG